ncbi:hypothetical protein ACPPVQ_03660 [Diaminobutyricibacter sp. McL0618]|uniref:aldose epimerase family protein n=1 Tax=Leifsonia sp. McL0618 TaxID=3415677 RepID=UPI003CED36E4
MRDWKLDKLGPASVTVDLNRGARISELTILERNILAAPDALNPSPFRDGLFAMAPYAGRLARARFTWGGEQHILPANAVPHSAHGVAADVAWSMPEPGVFGIDFDARWPFGGSAREEIRTSAEGMGILLTVSNDRQRMPASPGLHPWFNRAIEGTEAILTWPVDKVYRENALITSRTLVDRDPSTRTWTAPTNDQAPILAWPGLFELTLSSFNARCWVIHETEDAICVEPQFAPGNALNAGDAVIVSPGTPCTIDLDVRVRPLGESIENVLAEGRELLAEYGTPHPPAPTRQPGRS